MDPSDFEPGLPPAEQPDRHVQDYILSDWNFQLGLGLSERIAAELLFPVQLNRQRVRFLNSAGADITGLQSIHHDNETLFGLGDMQLNGRWGAVQSSTEHPLALELIGGLTIPTGNTEPDPFALGQQGLKHQHVFFGSGTIDPVAGFDLQYSLQTYALVSWGRARIPLYQNSHGYRGSRRFSVGVGIQSSLGTEKWKFRFQPEVLHETSAEWGTKSAENSGRTDIIPSIGAIWALTPTLASSLFLKFPINVHSEGGQLKQYVIAYLGLAYTFDLFESAASSPPTMSSPSIDS